MRRTIAGEITLEGRALHSGRRAMVHFRPAPAGTGIVFRRLDQDGPGIPAQVDRVTATDRRTVLGGPAGVATVEHVLAAAFAAGLDDLDIGVDGDELPAMDGSAAPFVTALREAGTAAVPGAPAMSVPARAVRLTVGDAIYGVLPAAAPSLTVTIDFAHPLIGRQTGTWALTPATVAAELAGARTFGFARDAAALAARGLAAGAGTDSVVVLTEAGLAGGALRWPDEFVRHKALDLIGDLMLSGGIPCAAITAVRPSHAGNVALARALRP